MDDASTMGDGGQIKLLGFSGPCAVADEVALRKAMSAELSEMKAALGERMTVVCGAAPGADLIFLHACVRLRIPAILFMPYPEERLAELFDDKEEWVLARHLMGVALARYVAPVARPDTQWYDRVPRHLLEWADAFLIVSDGGDFLHSDARALGIPLRIINAASLSASWEVAPDFHRNARHGFDTRADLLDFLDARFAGG